MLISVLRYTYVTTLLAGRWFQEAEPIMIRYSDSKEERITHLGRLLTDALKIASQRTRINVKTLCLVTERS